MMPQRELPTDVLPCRCYFFSQHQLSFGWHVLGKSSRSWWSSNRRVVVIGKLFLDTSLSCMKGFLTAWGELFCFCPAARRCSLIGPPVTIRNMVEGGASHTADRGATCVLCWPHAGTGTGTGAWSVQSRTGLRVAASRFNILKLDWICIADIHKSVLPSQKKKKKLRFLQFHNCWMR